MIFDLSGEISEESCKQIARLLQSLVQGKLITFSRGEYIITCMPIPSPHVDYIKSQQSQKIILFS